MALQYTFECNGAQPVFPAVAYLTILPVPSRLLTYLAAFIPKVEELASKGPSKSMSFSTAPHTGANSPSADRELDEPRLITQIRQALGLIQGFALNHANT